MRPFELNGPIAGGLNDEYPSNGFSNLCNEYDCKKFISPVLPLLEGLGHFESEILRNATARTSTTTRYV